MQIVDKASALRIPPFLRLAFRPFFLAAGLFSVITMLIWAGFWSGFMLFPMYGNPVWWHSHEMLFGFTGAVIVGFLLTAVQNWTGVPGISGWKLGLVFAIWLIARVALLVMAPHAVWMILDLLWLAMALLFLAIPIIRNRQWRNVLFLPVLFLLLFLNTRMHGIVLGWSHVPLSTVALQTTLLIAVLMTVMGGRVIPFFTARGTQTEPITRIPWREYLALWPMWAVFLSLLLLPPEHPSMWFGVLCMFAALAQIPRLARWRTGSTFRIPLLWMLHLAYYFTVVGVFLLGVSQVFPQQLAYSISLHVITVGGIGGMILAMVVRVSLGHTGRALQTGKLIFAAFVTLLMAVLVRTLLIVMFPGLTQHAYILSALLWAVAFGLFCIVFWPILTQARADGHPG
ncbi:NnrS family protein [Photobacterium sp. WH77]|uniref:NnrS family protein n=1 Tax=Photobacterium arenosum TaxID=2774143 RepID=A0ABR9BHT0_9GAMM|nr:MULTISPECIES: NnrS family protein [Photobacterium]MBD8511222.1 NnrS family protein [Photobacterium arenosum]MCG2837915.1 NnrS family protein [Photobacterium sp. WH77]MCG2845533.1 NnrS family protein [Photobacterium sp. WH80]